MSVIEAASSSARPSVPSLEGEVVDATTVTESDLQQMFTLMDTYYENVTEDGFRRDFGEKHWAIVARHPVDGAIKGFSTQMLIEIDDGRALFSGDTIVDRRYWTRNPLARLWGGLALALIDASPDPLWWFLISKGYKTYRFLPVFFHEFHPRVGVDTPPEVCELLRRLGRRRYADRFDASCGVLRASPLDERLRPDVAGIDERRRCNPDVEFFEARNPGHAGGDELCCLARLSRANFKPGAFKVIGDQPPPAIRLPW